MIVFFQYYSFLSFTHELGKRLIEVANEEPVEEQQQTLSRAEWMGLSEIRPFNESDNPESTLKPTEGVDWAGIRAKYPEPEINRLREWIKQNKIIQNNCLLGDHIDDETDFQMVQPDQLNHEQKQIYNWVKHHHENHKQLLLIMLGTAGTGKSFTINALTSYLGKKLKRAAPTAKAAYIIHGETIHSLLDIPASNNNTEPFLELQNDRLRELQSKFKETDYLIVDEFSMLSQVLIYLFSPIYTLKHTDKILV